MFLKTKKKNKHKNQKIMNCDKNEQGWIPFIVIFFKKNTSLNILTVKIHTVMEEKKINFLEIDHRDNLRVAL